MTAASEWTGKVGDVWAREWQRTERSFADLELQLTRAIVALAPEHGDFLDLGCGVGTTAAAVAAARPRAMVTGVDLSAPMVAVARDRCTSRNVRFVVGDAGDVAGERPRDLLFSRHGLMFFPDPCAALARLRRATVPGGTLVFSCFRARAENVWASELSAATGSMVNPERSYAPGPFAFADTAFVADLLTRSGWNARPPVAADYDYVAGEGGSDAAAVADALAFFARIGPAAAAIRAASGVDRATLLQRIGSRLTRYARNGRVAMPASAWIWTARATREPS